MLSYIILVIAGLTAGAINALAGGGTLISFPALIWIGVPPIMANATATLTALPGYIASAWAYRHDLHKEGTLKLRVVYMVTAVGGLIGAILLLVTSSDAFIGIIPWLLLCATTLFALGPSLIAMVKRRDLGPVGPTASALALGIVAIYGGYFNGGLGIILLAVLGLIGFENLHNMNGLKNLLSAILSVVSVTTYALAGMIAWESALVLAVATTLGGYLGARYARRIQNTRALRIVIVAIGVWMTFVFFIF
tara:strand:- start:1368 stop:2117 length:750 start_codon:yes stop_codon:yes gene_type:complete